MIVQPSKLDFWIKNGLNVLFVGKHGVGKTSIIVEAFNRNNLKWKYYSAATMDPWVDFIGVPREQKDDKGQSYLDLVKPIEWAYDSIEALFFDELNRSAKKIRNAVMELIQFKSINGKKFNNLKIIWAAINPEDEEDLEYDVEKLDPAQEDRFHIKVEIPYKPDLLYFKKKYDDCIADGAMEWWNQLPKEMKDGISPRRLDYALTIYKLGGDIRDALPSSSNVSKLITSITSGSIMKRLKDMTSSTDDKMKYEFFSNENNFEASHIHISKQAIYRPLCKYYPEEKISACIQNEPVFLAHVMQNLKNEVVFQKVIKDIIDANKNPKFVGMLKTKHKRTLEIIYPPSSKPQQTSISNPNNIQVRYTDLNSYLKIIPSASLFVPPKEKASVIRDLYNNIPDESCVDASGDVLILFKILDFTHGCNRPTLQRMAELPALVQCFMDRIIKRNNLKNFTQFYNRFNTHDSNHKECFKAISYYNIRIVRNKYSNFLPEIQFNYVSNPTKINTVISDITESNLIYDAVTPPINEIDQDE